MLEVWNTFLVISSFLKLILIPFRKLRFLCATQWSTCVTSPSPLSSPLFLPPSVQRVRYHIREWHLLTSTEGSSFNYTLYGSVRALRIILHNVTLCILTGREGQQVMIDAGNQLTATSTKLLQFSRSLCLNPNDGNNMQHLITQVSNWDPFLIFI